MKIGKKGFTLVEIIVSLAIMTIVAGAIGAFVVSGNNSYLRGNKELTLQEEAQLTANQMIDLIIDVEKGISFSNAADQTAYDMDGNVAKDVDGNEVNTAQVSELRLINNDNSYMIRWQGSAGTEYADANEVYLYEVANSTDADGKLVVGDFDTAKPALMAEHVSSFSVDLTELEKRKVVLNMTFTYQDKSYDISETIKLRNDLSAEPSSIYSWISGIRIIPDHADLKQGQAFVFNYEITGDDEAKAQGVTWKVTYADGSACKSTISANGKLSVADDENFGENVLLVTCTSVADPNMAATATVTIKAQLIDSLVISPKDAKLKRGESLDFTCEMTGDEDAIAQGVKWELSYVDGSATTSSILANVSTGTDDLRARLSVGNFEKTGTRVLRVKCTSLADSSMTDYADVMVVAVSGQYNAELIRNVIMPYEYTDSNGVNRIGWSVDLECLTAWADYLSDAKYPHITWEVVDGSGYTFEDTTPASQYEQKLKCGRNENTSVTVRASVQLSDVDWVYPEITIDIPELPAIKNEDTLYIASDNVVLSRNGKVTCWLEGKYTGDKSKIKWRILNDIEEGLAVENPSIGNNGEELGMSRRVGFNPTGWDGSTVSGIVFGGKENKTAGTMNLKSRGSGEKVEVYAKWYINWNDEHNLILQAYELKDENKGETQDNINVLAQTYLLIPRCEFYFSNGSRYYTIKKSDFKDGFYDKPPLYVELYGFKMGRGDFSASVDQGLQVISELEGEKPLYCFYNLQDIDGDGKAEKVAGSDGNYLYDESSAGKSGHGHTWIDGRIQLKDGNYIWGKTLLSQDGKVITNYYNEPGWITDEGGTNGRYAYRIHLYIAGAEQNEVLYLKFRDARDTSKTNERVTAIFWR